MSARGYAGIKTNNNQPAVQKPTTPTPPEPRPTVPTLGTPYAATCSSKHNAGSQTHCPPIPNAATCSSKHNTGLRDNAHATNNQRKKRIRLAPHIREHN